VGNNNCQHRKGHVADVNINCIEDTGRFMAELKIKCADCGTAFRFIGLPAGLDFNGASTSADAQEGRFAIAPEGEVVNVIEGAPQGFTIRKR